MEMKIETQKVFPVFTVLHSATSFTVYVAVAVGTLTRQRNIFSLINFHRTTIITIVRTLSLE